MRAGPVWPTANAMGPAITANEITAVIVAMTGSQIIWLS